MIKKKYRIVYNNISELLNFFLYHEELALPTLARTRTLLYNSFFTDFLDNFVQKINGEY